MFSSYFFVFFEGRGKERVARDFKAFIEGLLGEEAGVGRALERPWEDPALVKRDRTATAPGDPGHDGPWSYARSVFEFPTYEAHYREEDFDDPAYDDENGEVGVPVELPVEPPEDLFAAEAYEEEDTSLYLFGSDMPPEWRDSPITISFPPFALPAETAEDRRGSRPKAKKILRWLGRQQRRRRVEIHLSAGFFASIYLEPRELSAARLLTMASELLEATSEEEPPRSEPLVESPGCEDPEAHGQEPKDLPGWPAKIWRKWAS